MKDLGKWGFGKIRISEKETFGKRGIGEKEGFGEMKDFRKGGIWEKEDLGKGGFQKEGQTPKFVCALSSEISAEGQVWHSH